MAFPPFKQQEKKQEAQVTAQKATSEKNQSPSITDNRNPSSSASTISYDDFAKLDLCVGRIVDVTEHPEADKLYVLTVDLGEQKPRTIVAGLRLNYTREKLKGRQAIFVANLAPRMLKGIESNGMILATGENAEQVVLLAPEKEVKEGSKVK